MHSRSGMTLALPPFTPVVKFLVIVNCAVFGFFLVLAGIAPVFARQLFATLGLLPAAVGEGHVWQVITHAFLHGGFFHLLMNMLMLWMFGAALEMDLGKSAFLKLYFAAVLGGALLTVALSHAMWFGLTPTQLTIGASGGVCGVLIAFGMLHSDQLVFVFPLPFFIKAKYVIGFFVLMNIWGAVGGGGGVAYIVHVGGLLAGFLYISFFVRRRFPFASWLANARNQREQERSKREFQEYLRNLRKHAGDKHDDERDGEDD